jgi:uncharacterized repeat protein (TIGR03806 family)
MLMCRTALLALCLMSSACGGGGESTPDGRPMPPDANAALGGPVVVDVDAPPPTMLSAYRLFLWDPGTGFSFNDRVVPYELNTALFSDYALKQRALYVPPGATATFIDEDAFDLPIGAVAIKNFYFPADLRSPKQNLQLIETRLMVRHADGLHALPYIWTADQRDAVLTPAGEVRAISFLDTTGTLQTSNYLIPERNQCPTCHGRQASPTAPVETILIGLKARHLNHTTDYGAIGKQNEIAHLTELGMLSGAPDPTTLAAAFDFRPIEAGGVAAMSPADIDVAARSYLDINCAHCHNPNAIQGITSQLFLNHDNNDAFHLGVCKRPGSAGQGTGGFTFDIVPSNPDTSILYFRVHTTEVGAMMPLLGRSITHARGTELLHAWIAGLPANDCMAQ